MHMYESLSAVPFFWLSRQKDATFTQIYVWSHGAFSWLSTEVFCITNPDHVYVAHLWIADTV